MGTNGIWRSVGIAMVASFTTASSRLTESDIMDDMRVIGEWTAQHSGQAITLVGWSEGAGIGVLGAAAQRDKNMFDGLVTFGSPIAT